MDPSFTGVEEKMVRKVDGAGNAKARVKMTRRRIKEENLKECISTLEVRLVHSHKEGRVKMDNYTAQ